MEFIRLTFICAILASALAAPAASSEAQLEDRSPLVKEAAAKDDLNTAASSACKKLISVCSSFLFFVGMTCEDFEPSHH
jgi:hypothetical protein